MPRKDPRLIPEKDRAYYLELLWSCIAKLDSRDEVKNFFRDLLSETEAIMLARRIEIAKLLVRGEGYDAIIQKLKASPGTIAQVDRWLTSGFGGYERAIARLKDRK